MTEEKTSKEHKAADDAGRNENQAKNADSGEKDRKGENGERKESATQGRKAKRSFLSEIPWKPLGWSWVHAAVIVAVSFVVALVTNWIRGPEGGGLPLRRRRPFDIYTECPEVLDDIPTVAVDKVPKRPADAKGIVILDSRKGPAFCKGHIPGAWYVPIYATDPPDAKVLSRLKRLVGHWIVIYGDDTGSAERLATTLINAGVRGVRTMEGNLEAWKEDGRKVETCPPKKIGLTALPADEDMVVFVDARDEFEFQEAKIPGAISIPDDDVLAPDPRALNRLREIVEKEKKKNALIVAYDSGKVPQEGEIVYDAKRTAAELTARGYENVRVLEGGFAGWKNAGRQVEKSEVSSPETED